MKARTKITQLIRKLTHDFDEDVLENVELSEPEYTEKYQEAYYKGKHFNGHVYSLTYKWYYNSQEVTLVREAHQSGSGEYLYFLALFNYNDTEVARTDLHTKSNAQVLQEKFFEPIDAFEAERRQAIRAEEVRQELAMAEKEVEQIIAEYF